MSRLSNDDVVVQEAADLLAGVAGAVQATAAALAADATAIDAISDGIVADTTALRAMATGLAGDATAIDTLADGVVADGTALAALSVGVDSLNGKVQTPATLAVGTGIDLVDNYAAAVITADDESFVKTEIIIDIDGTASSGDEAFDIIGDAAEASANLGQITAAVNGTVLFGRVTCVQTPAGGEIDIDFYWATESTGAASAVVATELTETVAYARAGDWAVGDTFILTNPPTANDYLYIAQGVDTSTDAGTYTAGIFLIELWGI